MEPFIGQIQAFGFNFAPRGWAQCNGQLLSIASHSALFSLIGTYYGGDGRTTFGLPDLRGRGPIHFGNGPGLPPVAIGQKGGTASNVMTVNQMPAHNHMLRGADEGNTDNPIGGYVAGDGTNAFSTTPGTDVDANAVIINGLENTGGNQPQNNMQPYTGINYCIALVGIFPSRN